jgi:hypothetical protein
VDSSERFLGLRLDFYVASALALADLMWSGRPAGISASENPRSRYVCSWSCSKTSESSKVIRLAAVVWMEPWLRTKKDRCLVHALRHDSLDLSGQQARWWEAQVVAQRQGAHR